MKIALCYANFLRFCETTVHFNSLLFQYAIHQSYEFNVKTNNFIRRIAIAIF